MEENRKSYTLNHEKGLNRAQEKVMAIFSPLTRLYHIVEEERNLNPENGEEAAAGHNDIALLFEHSNLVVGQAFNSLACQIRLNILPTIIDNNKRVKEILKENSSGNRQYLITCTSLGINLKSSYPK